MLRYRGKSSLAETAHGEGGGTLRQCSSPTGTTRLIGEACDAAAASTNRWRALCGRPAAASAPILPPPLLTSASSCHLWGMHTMCLMICL
ncbi:hypothetical protein PAHAL_3G232000 [Panicum hallii]|uniref:Uncharacterized protein n=1 Tax=Panicum hallii TaxID=206008 RepID=A0A2T8KJ87_9POAL|nr:hypothetical protein PAHAL_3G232000 [Panicum hallii]